MSRRSHVVRSEDGAAPGSSRSLGGYLVFCATAPEGLVPPGGQYSPAVTLRVSSSGNYQRAFLAATVDGIIAPLSDGTTTKMVVTLHDDTTGLIAAQIVTDANAALTGIADLFAGAHDLRVSLSFTHELEQDPGSYGAAGLQVVLGQSVDQPGCLRTAPT